MLYIATFNIFWYPQSDIAQNKRSSEDTALIVRVLGALASDVIVFQEILDLGSLEVLLKQVAGRDYRLRKADGRWLASTAGKMSVACAYDAGKLDLVDAAPLPDPNPTRKFSGRRYPYAVHLRDRASGGELTVVGVHLKSGDPWSEDEMSPKRLNEMKHLGEWLAGTSKAAAGHFRRAPTKDVVVIGDFNAVREHASLKPLRNKKLKNWHQPTPKLTGSIAGSPTPLDDGDRVWSTFRDKAIIDHAFVAPATKARITETAWLYAFDRDPGLDKKPPGAKHWFHQVDSYSCKPWSGAFHVPVANLYRISDHRPLRIGLLMD